MIDTAPDHRAVALRAYFIWEDDGHPHGCHELHWLTAEAAEIRAAEPLTEAVAISVKKSAPAKAPATKKAAAPKKATASKDAPANDAAPKASAEAVVAAAVLATPRTERSTAKVARRSH